MQSQIVRGTIIILSVLLCQACRTDQAGSLSSQSRTPNSTGNPFAPKTSDDSVSLASYQAPASPDSTASDSEPSGPVKKEALPKKPLRDDNGEPSAWAEPESRGYGD